MLKFRTGIYCQFSPNMLIFSFYCAEEIYGSFECLCKGEDSSFKGTVHCGKVKIQALKELCTVQR